MKELSSTPIQPRPWVFPVLTAALFPKRTMFAACEKEHGNKVTGQLLTAYVPGKTKQKVSQSNYLSSLKFTPHKLEHATL